MANKNRDVELVIRAKNEASKAISAVTTGLKALSDAQDTAGKSADSAGSQIGKFAKEARTLTETLSNMRQIDKVSSQVDRMTQSVQKTQTELANLNSQVGKAASEQARLSEVAQRTKAAFDTQAAATAAADAALKDTNSTMAAAERRYSTLLKEVRAAKAPTDQLKDALRDQLNTVMSLVVAQGKAVTAKEREVAAEKSLGKELSVVNNDLKNAEGNQNDLAAAIAKANGSIEQQIAKIRELQAATRISARPAETVSGTGGMAAYGAQTKALGDAQRAYGAARAEVARLTKEMAGVAQPTAQMTQALELARAKSEQHRLAVQREGLMLSSVRQQALETARARKSATQAAIDEANASAQATAKKAAEAAVSASVAAAKDREAAANKKVKASYDETSDAARRSLDLTQRIRGQVLSMVAAYVGIPAVVGKLNSVVEAYRSLEATQNRLGATFGSQQKVAEEIDFLRRNADRLKISMQELGDGYGKFAVATKDTILQGSETRRIFISVTEAARVNKLTVEQNARVMKALTDIVSKGSIQAEELKQQLGDALPGAMQILAAGMGKTTAEIGKMMEGGLIGIDNLSKFADAMDKRFGGQLAESLKSVTSSMGDFENASFQAKLAFANGGFIEAFQEALDRLTTYLRSAEAATLINNISAATGNLVSALSYLPQYFRPIMVMVSALVGYKLAAAFIAWRTSMVAAQAAIAAGTTTVAGLTVATNASRTAILSAAAATRSWSILLGAAGGPLGLLITGASALLAVWATRTDDVTQAMSTHRDIVDKVKNAYDKADKSAGNWADKIKGVTLSQAQQNLVDMKKSMTELVSEMDSTSLRFRSTMKMPVTNMSPQAQESRKSVEEVIKALDDLKAGTINLETFKERLDAVNQSTKNAAVKEWTLALQNSADKAKDTERAVGEAERVIKVLTGTTEEAAKAGGELAGSFEETGKVIDQTKEKIEAYEKALNSIRKGVPSMKAEADKTDALKELEKQAEVLLAAGPPTKEAADAIFKRRQAILEEFDKTIMDALPKQTTGFYNRLIQNESGGDPNAKAKTSSATGLGQFTKGTWLGLFDKVFPALANYDEASKLALRTNADMSKAMLERLTQQNAQALSGRGLAVNDTTLYLAHFLGSGDAIKVLLANPDELVSKIVDPKSVKANPTILKPGTTAGDMIAWSARKMGSSGGARGLKSVQTADLLSSGRTQAETDAEAAEKKRLEAETALLKKRQESNRELDAQIAGLGKAATEQEIINELSKLQLTAESEEGRVLADKIRKKNEERDLQQIITDLQAQQSSLQTQITYATQQGDYATAELLKEQLKQINEQLAVGVQASIAYWQGLGGPQADAAIAKLKSINTNTENLNRKFLQTGQQIDEALAGSAANGLASVAEAIANGDNALTALGNSIRTVAAEFLLNIGKMIAQQAIFNALQSMGYGSYAGFGNAVMGSVGKLFHTGGVAGQPGGASMIVNPAIFSGAAKYHTGGVAGLKSNEIPAILEKGETIRTEDQEAALQSRMAGGGGSQPNIKIVNAIDPGNFVSEGMNTEVGQQAVLNFMRSNKAAINSTLS